MGMRWAFTMVLGSCLWLGCVKSELDKPVIGTVEKGSDKIEPTTSADADTGKIGCEIQYRGEPNKSLRIQWYFHEDTEDEGEKLRESTRSLMINHGSMSATLSFFGKPERGVYECRWAIMSDGKPEVERSAKITIGKATKKKGQKKAKKDDDD